MRMNIRQFARRCERTSATNALIKPCIQGEIGQAHPRGIDKRLNEYYIFEIDNNIVGLVALHSQPDSKKGELASLAVSPAHEHHGIGTN